MADELKETSEGSATVPVTDNTNPSNNTAVSSLTPTSTVSRGNKKARDGSHGLKFESKLLPLFCIRGLGAGYKFELGKENEDLAGKFDDVIFRYEVADETTTGKHWRYLYLQAKHKENEGRITANDLLDPKGNGPFSLKKYFLSYCKMRLRGDDVRDCIMCTNWGVNEKKFHKIKLEKVREPHDILTFASEEKSANIYKLQIDKVLHVETLKLLGVSDIEALGVTDSFNSDTLEIQFTFREQNAFDDQEFSVDLVMEKVVDSKTRKFHPNFLKDESLSVGAQKFRHKICDAIDDFFKKFIFVVDMPNETQFKKIIETEDISKYYQSNQCENQTIRIIDKISSAFENKPAEFWLTSEEGKKILLAGVTDVFLEYQGKLNEKIGFNDTAIQIMKEKLRQQIDSPDNKKVQRIFTPSPQFTAVKVISAVHILLRELKPGGNYLVVPSSLLQDKEEMHRWKNILQLQKGFHHFLVVVCDNEDSIENLFVDHEDDNNFGIIISRGEKLAEKEEEIKYTDLTEHFQNKILSKIVSLFQEEEKTLKVKDLIGGKPDEVIDYCSLEELLSEEKEIKIPSFNTSNFELYIKRRLKFPFDDQFEFSGECKISSDGHIEWLIEKGERNQVWKKIMEEITNRANKTSKIVDENQLMNSIENKEKERSVVIISGVAGSGKSTILSSYYQEIKKAKPDHWVIRINLVDHYESILKMGNITRSDAVDFLVNQLHVVDDKSSFSRSLLRNRLETGDRIIFLFDGFDEINDQCQEKAIHLMKVITKEKSIPLYVTTRTHLLDKLQLEFSQLAYILEKFTEKDQTDYLINFWNKEMNLEEKCDGLLRQFAAFLIERVSKTLNDQEKSFIGIPLQCRILAECFQSNAKELIGTPISTELQLLELDGQKFDILSLYERLMETKRQIFREEKANATDPNPIVDDAIDHLITDIEKHLTKLAIETIVTDQKLTKVLWPPQSSHLSDEELANEENRIASNGMKFGLTFERKDDAKIQFLHRTYAEYLFAKYLYKGFHLDDKRHNKLLENALSRKIIVNQILAMKQYDGVQTFFDYLLKGLVDKDKEWRDRIIKRDLPNRLNKFTENLFSQFLRRSPPLNEFPTIFWALKYYFVNALHFSLANGKEKIFKFFCDCLDATFDRQQVQQAMIISFISDSSCFSLTFFLDKESELFKRFLNYCDDNLNQYVYQIISKLSNNSATYPCGFPPCGLEYSQWNGEEQQKVVNHLLQFLDNQRQAFDDFCPNRENYIVPMLTFFIFDKNYDDHLKKFLGLLSRSTTYSDDSKFANLLEKAFCSKKHFIRGQIEKVLILLLERQNLLNQLYAIVLVIDPEAFQNIYQPLPLVGEDVTALDLNILMERDSYGMTRLHRAAFCGDTAGVAKILENIRQNLSQENETEHLLNIMARDKYGLTPLYVAAALGHEGIFGALLTFLSEQVVAGVLLENDLRDLNGSIHGVLWNAIKSENVDMFKLILSSIKREQGQRYLIDLLKTNPTRSDFPSSPCFVECKTTELFNAMAKIVVMKDDNSDSYFKDLHDLIFQGDAARTLKNINKENVQGLLQLNGVDDFTKRVLDDSIYLSRNFQLLSVHLLEYFEQVQLEEFVQTITSRNNTKKKRSFREFLVKSAPKYNVLLSLFVLRHLNLIESGWTREHLKFQDQGNGITTIYGERRVPICYWENFIKSALTPNYDDGGFVSREDVHCIFNCLKYVGDASAKKFFLHEDDKGFIMIQSSQTIVQLMLNHLTKESQEEVKQQWRNNAPPMSSFFTTSAFTKPISIRFARYCSDILRFYLNYGSENHLNEFIDVATSLRNIAEHGDVEFSVWSCAFEKLGKDETKEMLTLLVEKIKIIGRDDVKKLLLHEIDQVPFIIKSFSRGEDVDAWLDILPMEMKREIQQFIQQKAPDFVDKALSDFKTFFKTLDWRQHYNKLNTFTFFLNYQNDKSQHEQLMQNIMSPVNEGNTRSVWAELLTQECEDHKTDDIEKMDKFMKIVSDKLDSNFVRELVMHKDGEKPVIFYPVLRGEEKLLETMLNYLSPKDRKKIQRQVDEYLDKTFKIPSDGNWINNYSFLF